MSSPSAAGPLPLLPGIRPLPGYELIAMLGRGGFGEAWKATGPGGVQVALKFIRLDDEAGSVELKALQTIRDVRHAHLLSLQGVWQEHGYLILAQELADGTLMDRLRVCSADGHVGIPAAELFEYLHEAAKGLDYLNQKVNIQHRDVKPQNIFLVGGSVKVADFGLVKVLEKTVSSHTGNMTPAYAPPEMFAGEVSRWSDQYSLAISYCQLRGGVLPFLGNRIQIMAGHIHKAPDLTMLPAESERQAVARALAKKPEERWPSCRAFAEVVTGRSLGARPAEAAAPALPMTLSLPEWLTPTTTPEKEITNDIGMKLVWIPPGTFSMGSPADEKDRDTDETQHLVTLTRGFYLGKYEVTRGEFRKFVEDDKYVTEAEKDGRGGFGYDPEQKAFCQRKEFNWRNTGFAQTDVHPVVNVSWNDAVAFCRWLSCKEGKAYRLPTEAEWEYACRAGTTTRFEFGDDERNLKQAANIADLSLKAKWDYSNLNNKDVQKYLTEWFEKVSWDDGYAFTAPVGQFKANQFGLYDMHGNVWEWCQDWYGDYPDRAVTDPSGPSEGSPRVFRGGGWSHWGRYCRSAFRGGDSPADRFDSLGFRVAQVPSGST